MVWIQKSSKCLAVTAMVAGGGVAAVGFAGPASADTLAEQYIEVPQCQPNTSQKCPQEPQVHFTVPASGPSVQAHFTANANHCSDINVRMIKDDPTTTWYPMSDWMRVGPGQTVDSGKIDFGPGDHIIEVQAEGIEGGCNTGHLDAWGGTLRIDALPLPTPVPDPGGSLLKPPFWPGGPDDLGVH